MLEKSKTCRVCNNLFNVHIRFYYVKTKILTYSNIKSNLDPFLIWFLYIVNKLKKDIWQNEQAKLYKINPFIR